jgi:hypothetical protein
MLYQAFRAVDGEFHEAIARQKADRTLIAALRTTQIEHGQVLGGLVVDVAGLKTDVAGLKTDVAGLKTDVSELKTGQRRLEQLIRRGFNLPDAD